MSYETISHRIKDILDRIDNVYNVHTYMRDIPDEGAFEKAFLIDVDDRRILTGWMMTRSAVAAELPTFDVTNMYDITNKIELQGFYGLEDEKQSEMEFQQIIDNMYQTFRKKYLLEDAAGSSLSGVIQCQPIQTLEIGHGQFANYFVHFCRMLVSVDERLQ